MISVSVNVKFDLQCFLSLIKGIFNACASMCLKLSTRFFFKSFSKIERTQLNEQLETGCARGRTVMYKQADHTILQVGAPQRRTNCISCSTVGPGLFSVSINHNSKCPERQQYGL